MGPAPDQPGGAHAWWRGGLWRVGSEALLFVYLLTLPFGILLDGRARDPLLYGVILLGVLDAGLGPSRTRVRGLVPVAVFLGVHALTIVTSVNRELSIGLSTFAPVAAMLFVVCQRVLVTRAAMGRLYAVLGLVAGMIAIDAACQAVFRWSPLSFEHNRRYDRVRASLPHPNDLVLVPILLPFAVQALRERGRRWLVGGAVLLGPPVAVALLASKSRNAWLTSVGVTLVWSWLVLGRAWAIGAIAGVGGLSGVMLAFDLFGVRDRAGDFLRLKQDGLVGLWLVAIQMFKESPWLGKGAFTFGEFYRPLYMLRVKMPEGYVPESGVIPWAHSLPLELLSERGLAGFGSFVFMVGSAVWSAGRRAGRGLAGLREPRVAAAVTSLAGFLGASLLDLTLMKDWVALVLFLLLAVLWRLPETQTDAGSGPDADRA